MNKMLDKKNVVITGGAGGIGTATAKEFANEGANILIADLNVEAAQKVVNEIRGYGVKAEAYKLDLRDFKGHKAFVEKVEREFGEINVLINNAGISNTVTLQEMTEDSWDIMMDINLKGPFFLTREVFERMAARKSGRIINLGSISGERGAKYAGPHYSISKAGVIMLTKVLAKLAGDSGVTVNTVSPGIISTDMTLSIGSKIYSYDVPMNRMGTPEEIAKCILFLASPLADYITGQNISVNGGQSMR